MKRSIIIGLFAAALLLPPVAAITQSETEGETSATYRQLDLFGTVFQRVRANYVEEVSDEELIEAAITGMLTSLDPHSSYLNPKNYKEMQVQTRGEFGGLGIEVTMENGLIKVISPIDDTPAHSAGVKAGDLITHLDGKSVQGLSLSEAVERMRGKVDTKIRLTIRRSNQEPFDLTITRAVIKIRSVRWRMEGDVGYLRITSFTEQTDAALSEAVTELKNAAGDKLAGYVLDLRNNPGGLLDEAIAVSDQFINKGEIVSTRGRREEDSQRWNAKEGDVAAGLPMVVLINSGSASASEIVAGALQDHRRAIVMGTRSFGKGSVQTIVPLGGRGAMRLTTARYFTPSGHSIQARGIVPDIVVEQARIERIERPGEIRREADLEGALQNTEDNGGGGEQQGQPQETAPPGAQTDEPPPSEPSPEQGPLTPEQDYQLARALDLLRGLSVFGGKAVN